MIRRRRRGGLLITCVLCLPLATTMAVADLPRADPVPGGIVIVDLGPATGEPPIAHFQNRRVLVLAAETRWQAVVGIPLSVTPGSYTLQVAQRGDAAAFEVQEKIYAEQRLTVGNPRHVNPDPVDMRRIAAEHLRIQAALARWTPAADTAAVFKRPTLGEYSSPFGLRRYFNGEERKPHSGVDIAAPEGTPILAPATGRVIEIGDFFFNGLSVFVDHGQGLVSLYCHLSRIDVELGQRVSAGDQLGAIGMTGRVTGPHLHWTVSLNNARIDPLLMLE